MNRIHLIALSATALALAGCGRSDQAEQSATATESPGMAEATTAAATMPASPGQQFADAAAASDTFEIESSRLAVDKASSAKVKRFAQQMIDAHTKSTAKLKSAAASASPAITPNPQLTPDQTQSLDNLRSASGPAFDTAYAQAQTDGHQKTLDTLKAYAADGDVPSLKSFAKEMVPTVTGHLNMAKGLAD